MLYLEPFVTSRLKIKMRELAIGDAMSVALMPADKPQSCITAFLRAVIQEGGEHAAPELWTLQERTLAVCHYLMGVNPDQPNFAVGEFGTFLDYADLQSDIPKGTAQKPVEVGELEGDTWAVQHLTGYMLEAIERLMHAQAVSVPNGCARMHWIFCAMGAQLVREGEEVPSWETPGLYDDWLAARATRLLSLPESASAQLWVMYRMGCEQLSHFFSYDFATAHESNAMVGGPVFLPKPAAATEKEAVAVLQPATFLPISCVSYYALGLLGKLQKDGD